MKEQNKLFTSEKIQFKFITNENKFLKIYGIRKKAIRFDLNRLGEIFGAQEYKADYVPIRESLYVAKIDNEYERVKVAAIDDVAGVAYVTLLDAGNSSAAVPFHQVSFFHTLHVLTNLINFVPCCYFLRVNFLFLMETFLFYSYDLLLHYLLSAIQSHIATNITWQASFLMRN